jgi:bacterioferritin-associated ferredoxin
MSEPKDVRTYPLCLICRELPQERGKGGACAKCAEDARSIAMEWRR